jgi:hypothetical protein
LYTIGRKTSTTPRRLTIESDKGKPGENRGRKAMDLKLIISYDRQVAEEKKFFSEFSSQQPDEKPGCSFFSRGDWLKRKTQ